MPINAGFEFQRLEDDLAHADSISEKVRILQKMLQVGPKHKSAEKLRNGIKKRIVKYKSMLQKEKQASKGSGGSISIKKEGSAQVVLIGVTNVGKSTLLAKLTNAKPLIADYEFTTVLPEVGTLNYNGVIIQTIEVPAITENFLDKELGPSFLSIARHADLIVIVSKNRTDTKIIKNELIEAAIPFKGIIVKSTDVVEKVKKKIWSKLGLIYVFTKTPGKKKDYPPVALKKGSTVKELAEVVHKDFIKKFKFAKIWGASAKFDAQTVGLNHVLKEEDIIEVHIK
jgi:ribosome-interacting GTPase 1